MNDAGPVAIDHQRFGRIEVPEAEVIRFEGLPGFPEARRFGLLRHDRDSAVLWLVSLDRPDLAFVVTDPHQFFPDYDPKLEAKQLASVEATQRETVEVFSIATVREGAATLNLAAPLLIHGAKGRGVQLILDHGTYSTRQELPAVAMERPAAESTAP